MREGTLAGAPALRRVTLPLSAPSAILLLALFIGVLAQGDTLLGDPDTQWHVALGRWIWAARNVPSRDLFSHTFQGAPWIAKEWLSQLILFGAYAAGSWTGVVILAAASIAVAFALLHEWLRRRVSPTAALAMTLVAILLCMPHFLARPHILVLPIIVAWVTILATARERDRPPPPAVALLMALWSNMHGSFPLGLVLGGLLALEGVVAAHRAERARRLVGWGLFLALSVTATALSPYGWQAILVPLHMPGNAATLRYVDEWKPLHLDMFGIVALASLTLATGVLLRAALPFPLAAREFPHPSVGRDLPSLLAGKGARRADEGSLARRRLALREIPGSNDPSSGASRQLLPRGEKGSVVAPLQDVFRVVALALLAYLMIRHSRFISLFAIVTPILVARAVAAIPAFAPRPCEAPRKLWGLAGALGAAALVAAAIVTPTTAADVTPDAAYQAAVVHGVSGPVYNDYDFGGYLIAHGVPTFVDGRTDQLFLDPFLPALARAITSKDDAGFAALLARYHVDWAIVRAGSRDAAHIAAMSGWTRIHSDKVAEVFVAGR